MNSTLALTFPSDRELISTRSFQAPRSLVFEAFSSCQHIKNWWGPRRMDVVSCEMDFRTGGHYRFVHKDSDGTVYGFRGDYLEIVEAEVIEQTFECELMPGLISRERMVFSEENGITTITGHSWYDTSEQMRGHVDSGMEEGMIETFDRLEEYLDQRQEKGSC